MQAGAVADHEHPEWAELRGRRSRAGPVPGSRSRLGHAADGEPMRSRGRSAAGGRRTACTPDGKPAKRGHRVRRDRLHASRPATCSSAARATPAPTSGPRGRRQVAAGRAAALRRRGEAAGGGQRPSRESLRAPAGAGHEGLQGRPAPRRPRLRARLHRHPNPGADPRQEGRGRGGAQPAPAPGAAGRHLRRSPEGRLAARRLARQGRLRAGRVGRPCADAARAGRRHHRIGQVGLHQRDAVLGPSARLAERGSPGAGRPEAGRAEPLRAPPTPADPGGHQSADGRQRARQPDRRDGEPLRRHERGEGAQPGRAQPGASQGGRGAAAAHPLRDRRAGRPDDGRPRGGRGLDHPAGAEVARRRHPPGAGDPATVDRRDHGDDQGQHPGPDRLLGRLAGRLPRDPRPGRRRDPARPGRHAVSAGRDLEAAAPPGGVRRRGRDRPPGRPLGPPGRARVRRGAARGARGDARISATTSCRPITTTCSTRRRGSWSRARRRPSR